MKKYSLSIVSFIIAIAFTVSLSSCSRKVGCYWSLARDPESGMNIKSPERESYRVDMLSLNSKETESSPQTCDLMN